jgi:hypothetical protein
MWAEDHVPVRLAVIKHPVDLLPHIRQEPRYCSSSSRHRHLFALSFAAFHADGLSRQAAGPQMLLKLRELKELLKHLEQLYPFAVGNSALVNPCKPAVYSGRSAYRH